MVPASSRNGFGCPQIAPYSARYSTLFSAMFGSGYRFDPFAVPSVRLSVLRWLESRFFLKNCSLRIPGNVIL